MIFAMSSALEDSDETSGEYRSAAQQEPDKAVERWLRKEVAPGHTEYLADPSKGTPAHVVLARIKARRSGGNR